MPHAVRKLMRDMSVFGWFKDVRFISLNVRETKFNSNPRENATHRHLAERGMVKRERIAFWVQQVYNVFRSTGEQGASAF